MFKTRGGGVKGRLNNVKKRDDLALWGVPYLSMDSDNEFVKINILCVSLQMLLDISPLPPPLLYLILYCLICIFLYCVFCISCLHILSSAQQLLLDIFLLANYCILLFSSGILIKLLLEFSSSSLFSTRTHLYIRHNRILQILGDFVF